MRSAARLSVFYGWRTAANHEHPTQRSLRELDRISRAIEARIDGFAGGVEGWYEAQDSIYPATGDRARFCQFVPGE